MGTPNSSTESNIQPRLDDRRVLLHSNHLRRQIRIPRLRYLMQRHLICPRFVQSYRQWWSHDEQIETRPLRKLDRFD